MLAINTFYFKEDGIIPNSSLPVILYKSVINLPDSSEWLETQFIKNNWLNNWRATILPYDHFHSNTHEVLGLGFGEVQLKIGGADGEVFTLSAGDVIVIPAGVGHYSITEHSNYQFVGGYPNGNSWDLKTGLEEGERVVIMNNLSKVPIPLTDPLYGSEGILIEKWK
jgi:uncharacterized protein YjlB